MESKRYMSRGDVGALFGVPSVTVSKWIRRYAETDHPCPEPTVWIGDPEDGGTPGWNDAGEWKAWKEMLPGQGRGGGPLPLNAALDELGRAMTEVSKKAKGAGDRRRMIALTIAAAEYGVDDQTIKSVWVRIAEDNPTMPNDQVDQLALATVMRGRKRLELEPAPE